MGALACRFCGEALNERFIDLGMSPVANAYIKPENLNKGEKYYPLHAFVCTRCFLVQLEAFETPENIFSEYAYFSSFSDSWLEHAKAYCESVIPRFSLGLDSQVVEIASNDGYLLQFFIQKGVPSLGIEPAANVARAAVEKGIPTVVRFFDGNLAEELVQSGTQGDLIIGNNVLAHVPQINDFVKGMKTLLKPQGVITMEFPHLLRLMEEKQFDTVYHEHFFYFSFLAVEKIFEKQGLVIFDVDELPTHGGSLRIYAKHDGDPAKPVEESVRQLREKEKCALLDRLETYRSFSEQVKNTKRKLLQSLIGIKEQGGSIAGYGAPAKGNTLLNYCGIGTDFLDYTVDRNPHKQGLYLPGTHVPVFAPERIRATRPDYVLILPWNIKDEIMRQMAYIKEWGGRFIIPVPDVRVV